MEFGHGLTIVTILYLVNRVGTQYVVDHAKAKLRPAGCPSDKDNVLNSRPFRGGSRGVRGPRPH